MAPFIPATFLNATVSLVTTSVPMLSVCTPFFLPPPRSQPLMRTTPVNFINHHNPNHPSGSSAMSLLSNITWPKYTLDSKKMLLFNDNAGEEYTTIPDTYRADGIAAINEVETALGV